jgi:hypothetical protein
VVTGPPGDGTPSSSAPWAPLIREHEQPVDVMAAIRSRPHRGHRDHAATRSRLLTTMMDCEGRVTAASPFHASQQRAPASAIRPRRTIPGPDRRCCSSGQAGISVRADETVPLDDQRAWLSDVGSLSQCAKGSCLKDHIEAPASDELRSYGATRRRLSHSQDEAGVCARSIRSLGPRPTRACPAPDTRRSLPWERETLVAAGRDPSSKATG